MTYNWCHGPSCHTNATTDRVRGSKGNKVLRTRKIKTSNWNRGNWYGFFCGNRCYDEYVNKYIDQVMAIAPRREPLETPIKDPTKDTSRYYNIWNIEKKVVDMG
tara:strand:- start:83 stop:394 length:312 start_codon:yes stop_codon:yes gene_type:complete